MNKITLVKYNYDSLPTEWKKENPNKYEGITFAFLGEVKGLEGHGYYQDVDSGKSYMLHLDSMVELTEEEL
jgi:hypothetical protein